MVGVGVGELLVCVRGGRVGRVCVGGGVVRVRVVVVCVVVVGV